MSVRRNVNIGNVATWIRQTGNVGGLQQLKLAITAALATLDISGAVQSVALNASAATASLLPSDPQANKPQINLAAVLQYVAGVEAPTSSCVVNAGSPNVKFNSSTKKITPLSGDPFANVAVGDTLRVYNAEDLANDREFTVASKAHEVVPAIFSGAGLNDLTAGGTYSGSATDTFYIEIDTAAGTDKFKWKKNSGSFTTLVTITGSAQTLSDGVTVTFAATTGHTLTNNWTIKTPVVPVTTEAQTTNALDTASSIYLLTPANLTKHNRVEELATLLALLNTRL